MRSQLHEPEMPSLALLAGGLATRLGEMSRSVPKSLVQVADEPFLAHQLRLLAAQGVRDVVLCLGHLGGMIEEFADNGSQFGLRVRYSHDGPIALGTGGALVKALPLLGERFWVMYGDSYLTASLTPALRAFEASGKLALMTVYRNDGRWDTSNVEFSEGRIVRYAKGARSPKTQRQMRHIDYGLGLYRAEAFIAWQHAGPFDLSQLQAQLSARGELAGLEVAERFYEIGSPAGLAETDMLLRARACA